MKKVLALVLTVLLSVSLVACVGSGLPKDEAADSPNIKEPLEDLVIADSLKLNIAMGNNQRTITYQQATPLTLSDGRVITQGALKPTWQYIQNQIGIQLVDVTVQDQAASEMMDVSAATGFKNATVYGGNSIAEQLMSYGAQGYFVDLKDYLDYMPNFINYLNENPAIQSSITAYDGGIYYVPYAAEIGNYARAFHGRETWVTALLDSDKDLMAENATLTVHYDGYWENRNATNVIILQNQAASNGVLNRNAALSTLVKYINDTYPELEKPSDLYLGKTAKYDIDELVALWRVLKLSPNTLSSISTGAVVEGAQITPFFVRHASYREDLLRLATYFGGQRVHGSDSYSSRFYLDQNGELQFSYAEDSFIEILEYFRDFFAEGLIHTEFSDLSNRDNFRSVLYSRDMNEGNRQFGFMTFDWFASTTAANDDIVAMLPPVTTVDSDKFIHFIENTRVIKPDGWAISSASSQEEINAAIVLFDYMFSEAGHIAQNYGIPENLETNEKFIAPSGEEYPKFNQWLLDSAQEYKNGDVSAFLRDFMGSQIPIGYQKEIGFELQYTNERGWKAWELHESANVVSTSYSATEPLYQLVPSVFSLTEQDLARLGTIAIGEDQVDAIFLFITGSSNIKSASDIKQMYKENGIDTYIQVYRTAYERMKQ